jgi:predicted transcriptional regulator
MTPVVFSVPTEAPIARVIQKVLALEVRCLFVTDKSGVLVGVISVFDLLRTLGSARPERNWIGSVEKVAA